MIDQQLIYEGKVELTSQRQARMCNSIGLYKLVNHGTKKNELRWTVSFEDVTFFSANQKERLTYSAEHMLIDVFPWLKMEEQRFLPTVKDVCAALR